MDPSHLLVFALVMTCSGFTQSCVGFGYATVALALLPNFMDVRLVNLAVSLSAIIPIAAATWSYRAQLDRAALAWSLIGAALLLPIGLLTFAYLPADWLVRGTGLVIFLMMLRKTPQHDDRQQPAGRRLGSAGAGAISGFLAGAVGIGGPPIAAYAIRQPWSPAGYKAFVLGFLLIESIAKGIGVAAAGWVDEEVLLYTAIAIPFAVAGGRLGVAAAERLHPARFQRIVTVLLIAASLGMIYRGNQPVPPTTASSGFPTSSVATPRGNAAEAIDFGRGQAAACVFKSGNW